MLQRQLGQVYPVHRLDFEVSGLVLYALTPEAHRAANGWWETRSVVKFYEALTHNLKISEPGTNWETWTSKLIRGKRRAYESPVGQEAITEAKCTMVTNLNLRWSLKPLTGRGHQLRYELAKRGFPILGDVLYGAAETKTPHVIFLRAVKLELKDVPQRDHWGLPETLQVPGL